jgi:hypothetical protein
MSNSSLTPAWSDNMGLDQLNATLKINSSITASTEGTDPQRFWATPERMGDDDSHECMEISLANEKLVNHITFDLAKFPHDCRVEYFDIRENSWRILRRADTEEECGHTILECNPPVLPPSSNVPGHNHPHHSYSGHWESCEFLCMPTRFTRLRVVLKRHTRGHHPCNSRGHRVAFSLAVRNFYCGYKVYSRACIPAPTPKLESYTEHKEFASSTDVLGSQVSYSYRVNRAENILHNPISPETSNRSATSLVWRCEPQPFPEAVVNYFMDVRDSNGDPQLLDRFYVDPLYDGPNVNLYYSNDEPEADFEAPDDPIPPPLAIINGPVSGPDPLGTPTAPVGIPTWVDMDAKSLCFRPAKRWWFGCRLNWRFLRTASTHDHPIIDFGEFHLAWTAFGLRFGTKAGDYFHVDCDDFHPADDFTFMTWHEDGHAHVKIKIKEQVFFRSHKLSVTLTEKTIASVRIGGFLTNNLSCDYRLRHMCLKVDQSVDDDLCDDFLHNPEPYCKKPEFPAPSVPSKTNNAILRYDPAAPSKDFPTGLKGGTPTKYSAMEWAPIARNYVLRKGYLQFPPTKAKYWKFEFCSLVPEPYEVYVPIRNTVKTYRTEMWLQPVPAPMVATRIAVMVPGLSVHVDLSLAFNFRSSVAISVNSHGVSAKGYSSTTVRVGASIHVAVALTAVSWVWGFVPAHPPTYVPRFETKCVHEYSEIEIDQQTKTAFFVGLKAIQPYKVSYLATDDTAQYDEQFQDEANIESDAGWTLTGDHELTSGSSRYAEAQSKPFLSNRTIRAVQFATTQSAPTQLLPDDDFDSTDPSANWREVGDGTMAPFTTIDQRIGSILRVDRTSRQPSWDKMSHGGIYPLWSSITNQGLTWDDVERSGNPAQNIGGVESRVPVDTPPGGRIYAAARVIAPADLSSPLYVQIIDELTGQVLSEERADVRADTITEWYASYTVGESSKQLAWRWKDFATKPLYPTYVDNFAQADGATLGTLTVSKQNWLTTGTSHSRAAGEAVATAGTEYDYVDTIVPWGTFEMTVGTIGTTGTAKLFELLPIMIDDQGVVTYSGGRSAFATASVFGRALVAGDAVRIDTLPSSLVPSNRRDPSYVDAISTPYSMVAYLNGTWVKTVHHRLGARTRRGFRGRAGQHFRSFSWLPAEYGQTPGPTIWQLPGVVGNGTFDTSRQTWTSGGTPQVWAITGTVDETSTPGVLTLTSPGRLVTDTKYWYGCLSVGVRHVASGTMGAHGDVLVLDADLNATINAAGNVMVGGVSQGNLIPGGVPNNSFVQIQFIDTKSVAASIRGSINATTFPKMLRALVNGAQVGVLAFAGMQTWTGTKRGFAGDVYDGAAGTPIADYHTSFDSFNWAPDASNVSINPGIPTWDEMTQRGTQTFDGMGRYLNLTGYRVRARVIQRGESSDLWDMDTLSLFVDPIVWSFSNDGGLNFYEAKDIKNNPNGVMLFPEGVAVTVDTREVASQPGQSLIWRVISYAPGQKLSSLTIRPWYGGLLSGITHRVGLATGGPNVMPYDHYPPIDQDARFKTWSKPVPSDWYYKNRVTKRSIDQPLVEPSVILLSDDLTSLYHNEQVS